MPEREHNLPTNFNRLDDQITGPVLDSIMVYPRSRGILYLPGEYSTDSRPPAYKVEVATGEPGNAGVYTEENQLGGPDHYLVNHDIWNHRDSPAFARIILTAQADQDPADTQGVLKAPPRGPARADLTRCRTPPYALAVPLAFLQACAM